MNILAEWFKIFESSKLLKDIIESVFYYLPDGIRAKMPHYIAVYMLVSAVCLLLSVLIRRRRRKDGTTALFTAAGTAVLFSIAVVLIAVAMGDPIHNLKIYVHDFLLLIRFIVTDVFSLSLISLLKDVLTLILTLACVVLYGGLTFLPLLPIYIMVRLESDLFGPFTPVGIIGHSFFVTAVILFLIISYMLFFVFALPFILVIMVIRNWIIIP